MRGGYAQLSDSERAALDGLVDDLDLVELDDGGFESRLETPVQGCERGRVFLERRAVSFRFASRAIVRRAHLLVLGALAVMAVDGWTW